MKDKRFWHGKLLAMGTLVLAAGAFTAACGDSDGSSRCEFGQEREFACGSDQQGSQPQTCVDGEWYSTSFCKLPDGSHHPDDTWGDEDDCIEGATRAAVCGEGNRGLQPQECRGGEWEATSACTYGSGPNEPDPGNNNNPTPGNNNPDPGNNSPDPNKCDTFEKLDSSVSGDVTLDGCYDADNGLSVGNNSHLTLEPGTIIRFGENVGMDINKGKLTANGTENAGILLTSQRDTPGYWRGVRLSNTISMDNSLEYVTIEYGGSEHNYGDVKPANLMFGACCSQKTEASVKNVTLRKSKGYGLFANATAAFKGFSGNLFTENELGAARVSVATIGDLDDTSDYTGNTVDAVIVYGGTVNNSATIKGINVPYHVTDKFQVSGNDTHLEIEAGAIFKFDEMTGMDIKGASLSVTGTKEEPVVFEGMDSPPGFWRGIRISDTIARDNKIDHAIIDGGGHDDNYGDVKPANLMLGACCSKKTQLKLTNTTLRNSAAHGLYTNTGSTFAEFSKNTLTKNAAGAANMAVQSLGGLDSESDYSGNDEDIIRVYSTSVNKSADWKATNVPYEVIDKIEITGSDTAVTIEPGATFQFSENQGLQTTKDATLTAVGEADKQITFKGVRQQAGYWRGISFSDTISEDNLLENVTIDGGGSADNFGNVDPANLMLGACCAKQTRISAKNVTLTNSGSGVELFLNDSSSFKTCESFIGLSESDVDGGGADDAVAACGI